MICLLITNHFLMSLQFIFVRLLFLTIRQSHISRCRIFRHSTTPPFHRMASPCWTQHILDLLASQIKRLFWVFVAGWNDQFRINEIFLLSFHDVQIKSIQIFLLGKRLFFFSIKCRRRHCEIILRWLSSVAVPRLELKN